MTEGGMGGAHEEGKAPEAGGMPVAAVPVQKKFFLVEYFDEMRRAFKWLRATPKPPEAVAARALAGLRTWAKGKKARYGVASVLAIMLVSWMLFSAQAGSTPTYQGGGQVGPGPSGNSKTATIGGQVGEQSSTPLMQDVEAGRLSSFRAALTWSDEPVGINQRNQPDQLGLDVRAPNGKNWSVAKATSGSLTWSLDDNTTNYGAGAWNFTVTGGTMGDVQPISGRPCLPLNLICQPDTGNSFTLKLDWAW